MLLYLLLTVFIIGLDQYTKYLAGTHLKDLTSGTYPVFKNIFHLTYVENKGAAFSILQNQRWLFIAIAIIFSIGILYYLLTNKDKKVMLNLSLSLILAGAVGNLIDRIRLGYVIDFFDFRAINFAIFNVADSSVVVGTILLCVYLLFFDKKLSEKK
jgi:signal peptidase II